MSEKPGSQEVLQNNGEILATLFRTSLLQERTEEMTSGMMYRPSKVRVLESFHKLFSFEGQDILVDNNIDELGEWVEGAFDAMDGFLKEKTRVRYETSYPNSPLPGQKSNELMHFHPPHKGSACPTGLFFLEGNNLMYQMGEEKGMVQQMEPVEPGLIKKIRTMLLSREFETNFNQLQRELPYHPKDNLRRWASY